MGYGIDLQQVSCASLEGPQVKEPELCHGIPRQRDRSVRGRARSQSLCPGLLAPPVSGAGMQQAASLIIQKTSFPSAAHLHYFFSSLLCMHPHNKHACSLHGALLTSLVLHQRNPTSFFLCIQIYANNCKICNSVLHLLLYIYYIPSMSLLFKVNCMHFFAESSEAPCLNKVAAPLTDLTEREHWFLLKFYCTLMAGWSM